MNAACRLHDISYSRFVHALSRTGIQLNRNMLSTLAHQEPFSFHAILKLVQEEQQKKKQQKQQQQP